MNRNKENDKIEPVIVEIDDKTRDQLLSKNTSKQQIDQILSKSPPKQIEYLPYIVNESNIRIAPSISPYLQRFEIGGNNPQEDGVTNSSPIKKMSFRNAFLNDVPDSRYKIINNLNVGYGDNTIPIDFNSSNLSVSVPSNNIFKIDKSASADKNFVKSRFNYLKVDR